MTVMIASIAPNNQSAPIIMNIPPAAARARSPVLLRGSLKKREPLTKPLHIIRSTHQYCIVKKQPTHHAPVKGRPRAQIK